MAKQKKEFNGLQKKLLEISYRHQITRVFDDFMQMSICCYAMQTMEEEYLSIAKQYNKEELNTFSHALAEMINEYERAMDDCGSWEDILGNVFEEINSSSQASHSGQFFTPKCICDLMAKMVTDNPGETVADPTCGSGRNLIAHCRLDANNRFNTFYYGFDLDNRCVNMTVLNMIMFGMKGVVIHMNTLSMEVYKGYRIWMPEMGSRVQLLTVEQCKQYLLTEKIKEDVVTPDEEASPIVEKKPLLLFDY